MSLQQAGQIILVSSPTGLTAIGAITLGEGGVKIQKFKKELIRVGNFTIDNGTRQLDVELSDLQSWRDQFDEMKAAGNRISIPSTHEAHGDATRNQGWVDSMFIEDNKLFGVLELHGEKAIAAASTSDVSIWAKPNYEDGNGNKYAYPIRHVAMTSDPQIPGMSEFIPIAASNDDTPVDVPVFKPHELKPKPKGVTMNLAQIFTALCTGLTLSAEAFTEKMSEADFTKAIKGALESAVSKAVAAVKKPLDAQIKDLQLQVKEGGGATEIKLSDTERHLSQSMLNDKINALVTDCKLDAKSADDMRKELGTDLMLSVDSESKRPAYQAMIDIIAKNDPVALGAAASRTQSVELAHPIGNDDEERKKVSKELADSIHPAAASK